MVAIKAGTRLRSAVGETEIIIIRSVAREIDLRCGGTAMVVAGSDEPTGSAAEGLAEQTNAGTRYSDDGTGIEVLVTRGGVGTLSVGADALARKAPNRLPSSD